MKIIEGLTLVGTVAAVGFSTDANAMPINTAALDAMNNGNEITIPLPGPIENSLAENQFQNESPFEHSIPFSFEIIPLSPELFSLENSYRLLENERIQQIQQDMSLIAVHLALSGRNIEGGEVVLFHYPLNDDETLVVPGLRFPVPNDNRQTYILVDGVTAEEIRLIEATGEEPEVGLFSEDRGVGNFYRVGLTRDVSGIDENPVGTFGIVVYSGEGYGIQMFQTGDESTVDYIGDMTPLGLPISPPTEPGRIGNQNANVREITGNGLLTDPIRVLARGNEVAVVSGISPITAMTPDGVTGPFVPMYDAQGFGLVYQGALSNVPQPTEPAEPALQVTIEGTPTFPVPRPEPPPEPPEDTVGDGDPNLEPTDPPVEMEPQPTRVWTQYERLWSFSDFPRDLIAPDFPSGFFDTIDPLRLQDNSIVPFGPVGVLEVYSPDGQFDNYQIFSGYVTSCVDPWRPNHVVVCGVAIPGMNGQITVVTPSGVFGDNEAITSVGLDYTAEGIQSLLNSDSVLRAADIGRPFHITQSEYAQRILDLRNQESVLIGIKVTGGNRQSVQGIIDGTLSPTEDSTGNHVRMIEYIVLTPSE